MSLLSEATLLLVEALLEIGQLGIQCFNLLVLPLLFLSQNLKIELHVGCIVSLQSANIDLVLKMHQAVLICMLKLENFGDNGMDDRIETFH